MRILVFAPYYPPHLGGLEAYAEGLNEELAKRNVAVTVFAPRLPAIADEEEVIGGVSIIRFPAFEIIPNYPLPKFWRIRFWRQYFSFFKTRPHVVVSHTRFFCTSFLALIYAKIKKTAWMHIEHGSDFVKLDSPLSSGLARFYDHTLGSITLRSADQIVSVSRAVSSFVKKITGRKSKIIYRGFDVDRLHAFPDQAKVKAVFPDTVIITFIGRLIDGKGIPDLIKAIRRLKNRRIHCLIVGDGPRRKAAEALIRQYNLEKKITMLGYQRYKNAIGILKISDIFVNPSYTEGLPTGVVEAGLLKKAVVATDVGGTNEIITNGTSGFLYRPKDIESLVSKLELLIDDADLRLRMGLSAASYNKEKFNWNRSTKKYLLLLNKIIEKKKQ